MKLLVRIEISAEDKKAIERRVGHPLRKFEIETMLRGVLRADIDQMAADSE